MKGVCSVTFRKKSVEEIIALTVKADLKMIEWGADIHVPPTDLANAERVGKLTRAAGLTSSYGSYWRGTDDDFLPVSECALALGAPVIRVWAGEKDAEQWSGAEYRAFAKRMERAAAVAAKNGQKIAFEYHYGTWCNRAERTVTLLTDVGAPNLRTYFQPMYWLNAGGREEEENERAARLLRPYVEKAHVYAWRGRERRPLEEGAAAWKRYAAVLGGCDYLIEFVRDDAEDRFLADAAALDRILGASGNEEKTGGNL